MMTGIIDTAVLIGTSLTLLGIGKKEYIIAGGIVMIILGLFHII